MDLYTRILNTPQRENAGALAGNRFQYQYHWALLKLLKLFETQEDFVLLLEFCEDIIVLDSSDDPKEIDFYQIKTNAKANSFYWNLSDFTNAGTSKKPKQSFAQKLIDNFIRYEGNIKQIHFVSNKHFKFKEVNTLSSNVVSLESLTDDEFKKIQENICSNCKQGNCNNECKKLIVFNVSELSLENFRQTCLGILYEFLDKHCNSKSIKHKAIYETLISEIERKSNLEKIPDKKEELIKLKSITRQQFLQQLMLIDRNSQMYYEWNIIHTDIAQHFNMIETAKIKKAFEKLIVDVLNPDNLILHDIISFVQLKLSNIEDSLNDNVKKFIHEVVVDTRSTKKVSTNIYDDYYLIAIILRELKK
ncbi:hypothetical protein HMPREF1982_03723 [Clostridiales bacterium oral taxon 876 str. F0540]|nr:hypothetical protein HMPREF1982_03723 [Clostridiales bacterium oral taxon 876 str. F0540]